MSSIPSVPEQNPSQSELWLPRVTNPFLDLWFTSQTVTDVPESIMGWLVAQGYEVVGIRQDATTVPPTNYFSLRRNGMQPLQVLLSLCNNYTIAANEARTANQVRYNQILANWTQMIDSSHVQFDAQTSQQNAQAGVYLADLDQYMNEIDDMIRDNQAQIVIDAEEAKAAIDQFDDRLSDLETNAQNSANVISGLFDQQDTDLQTFINDYTAKLAELDANFAAHLASVLADVSSLGGILNSHVASYNEQFLILANNYSAHASAIDNLLDTVANNVTTYVADVNAILNSLESDYFSVENDLSAFKTQAGSLANQFAVDYQDVLDLLVSDYNVHASATLGYLNGLGATELARINEQFAANLAAQLQQLVSRGLYSSIVASDITARNHRDRDEQIQLLNDRLNREKLDNEHRIYEQRSTMRSRTLDGTSQLHSVRQEVLRYQASLVTTTFSLLQEARNRILAGKQAIFAAKDANARLGIDVESQLYARLQDVRQRTADSLDRIYQLRDLFAKWDNTETNRYYEQLQQIEAQHIAAINQQHGSKQDITRGQMSQRDTLLQQLQAALNGLIGGKERYAALLMQNANILADHRQKAIVQKMNVAVQRLDGWKLIADQNRALMAYQLDERNKLLVGLYSFVERRDDISPEWAEMSKMVSALGDSSGGWLTPN